MTAAANPGSLFAIVAPSGAGKTSLVRGLLETEPAVRLSVSYTTRPPRPGEQDGVDYHFVSEQDFIRRRDAGEFLEWAQVHGNLYATSQSWIAAQTAAGSDILLEIDWQGAEQVSRIFPDTVGIFIAPPSIDELRRRLQGRAQDSAAVIERRIAAAQAELAQAGRFQYVIINQDFGTALEQLCSIVRASRLRFAKQQARNPDTFASLHLGG